MNGPMIEPATSTDTLSGIRIEESLNSQFSSQETGALDRKVGETQDDLFENLIIPGGTFTGRV